LTVTISGAAETDDSDTANKVQVTAGQLISVEGVASAAAVNSNCIATLELV